MRILITGGAGFIGSHLAAHFHRHAAVRVLDDLRTGHRDNLAGLDIEFVHGSILDRVMLSRVMQGVDYVYHLAAFVSAPQSILDPHTCVELNVTGLLNVLEAAATAGVRKLCFSSSAAVYGDSAVVPKREDMCPEPRSPYGVTKLDGEFYCRHFTEAGRLKTVALRFFNVFGPRQDPAGPYGAAVAVFFQRALGGKPLVIFGDGSQTRDFIYVRDIVPALEYAALTPGLEGVFNAGYGDEVTILELAQRILSLTGSRSSIQFESERPGDVHHSRASVARLRNAGFRPTGTLDSGLRELLSALRSDADARLVEASPPSIGLPVREPAPVAMAYNAGHVSQTVQTTSSDERPARP
ncbi:MAG: NAD-dependent epimerase/dehydratase family protein [Verrucomicrobia bacterium]|nr:NAD-dependent epimerase/dehydratase family protein [Verrucomicrobiota bacterium]